MDDIRNKLAAANASPAAPGGVAAALAPLAAKPVSPTNDADGAQIALMRADKALQSYDRELSIAQPLAARGNAEAAYDLGMLYLNGHGTAKDTAIAAGWLRIAADKDYASAQYELAKLYASDEDVRELVDLARRLEGLTRNAGMHAGGVVIAPSMLTDFTPLYAVDGGTVV